MEENNQEEKLLNEEKEDMATGIEVNYFTTGIAIGMLFGISIGSTIGNLALGMGVGIMLGVLFGLCWQKKSGKQEK